MKKLILLLLFAGALWNSSVQGALNEWTFDEDAAGLSLTLAANSGTDFAAFEGDDSVTLTDGDRGLVCRAEVDDVGDYWTDGAILNADVADQEGGVRYLRYDLDYDMTSTNNNTGTLIGMAFTDGVSSNLAGVALRYDVTGEETIPSTVTETVVTNSLELTGHLSVIAKVDLDASPATLAVWYDLSGGNVFNDAEIPDAMVSDLSMTTIEELQFRATGDFLTSTNNADSVTIDNIRTALTWDEITAVPADYVSDPELSVSISGDDAQALGATNTISVTISNEGGLATDVNSTLTGADGLSIEPVSNAATDLITGESVVHTYNVSSLEAGQYVLTAEATSGSFSASDTFDLAIGSRISFVSYVYTNEVGGIVSGRAEPGETFDLIVSSINDGGQIVDFVTNRLVAANSAYFPTITPDNDVYTAVAVGDTNATTYTVSCAADAPAGVQTFYVINSSSGGSWTNTLTLTVYSEAIPYLSADTLTLNVVAGNTATGTVTLYNDGNAGIGYTVSDDGRLPCESYTVTTQSVSRLGPLVWGYDDFNSDCKFDSWSSGETAYADIGFTFPLFGIEYSQFSVSDTGTLSLETSSGSDEVTLSPFETTVGVDQDSIRYEQEDDRLVVSWGYGTGQEFQLWLNSDGRVQYLYQESDAWDEDGAIALVDQTISYTPGERGRDCLLMTLDSWVSYSPLAGSIEAQGSRELVFTADASELDSTGTHEFTATVTWGNGGSDEIEVTVEVEAVSLELEVPESFTFSGAAGSISAPAYLTITNSGNAELTYSIVDSDLSDAGYSSSTADYVWSYAPLSGELSESELGEESVSIGFPFVYYGTTYTNLTVYESGYVTFGDDSVSEQPYSGVSLDDNASIRAEVNSGRTRFVVTWENMYEADGKEDQTFQLVLYRSGLFRYNYKQIYTDASYITTNTVEIVETNDFGHTTVTGYDETYTTSTVIEVESKYSTEYTPEQTQIITASPVFGTVSLGGTATVKLLGDARDIEYDGVNVTNTTTLAFEYDDSASASVDVVFVATNNVSSTLDSDSDGMTDAAEYYAGTDATDSGSVFTVSSEENADGTWTLSWSAANDDLSRVYTVYYSTNLVSSDWYDLASVTNATSYTVDEEFFDAIEVDSDEVFFKAMVE